LFAAFGDGKRVFQICQFCVHLIFAEAFSLQRAAHTLLRSSECNATENALKLIKIIENCFLLAALSSSGRFKAARHGHILALQAAVPAANITLKKTRLCRFCTDIAAKLCCSESVPFSRTVGSQHAREESFI
jgi:hypothetical protein